MSRKDTKVVHIGDRVIGGGNPILIQSMCNTKTEDVKATVAQILSLEKAGCDIIRVAVPTMKAAEALKDIKKEIHIPLVADIHFDYRLAIAAMENGADKIRINPGNIGSTDRVKAVVDRAKAGNIPIRVGVNSGSLEKDLVEKYGGVTAEGIVESALDKVHLIEDMGYDNLVISIKSSANPNLSEQGPSILLTQDRSVAQKPHWGFRCFANANFFLRNQRSKCPQIGRFGCHPCS